MADIDGTFVRVSIHYSRSCPLITLALTGKKKAARRFWNAQESLTVSEIRTTNLEPIFTEKPKEQLKFHSQASSIKSEWKTMLIKSFLQLMQTSK